MARSVADVPSPSHTNTRVAHEGNLQLFLRYGGLIDAYRIDPDSEAS
jgi:hypothetical protein